MKDGLTTTQALYGDDATSATGSWRIKARIEHYWSERGHRVHVTLKRLPYIATAREAAFTLESDMINGLPRDLVKPKREGQAA